MAAHKVYFLLLHVLWSYTSIYYNVHGYVISDYSDNYLLNAEWLLWGIRSGNPEIDVQSLCSKILGLYSEGKLCVSYTVDREIFVINNFSSILCSNEN